MLSSPKHDPKQHTKPEGPMPRSAPTQIDREIGAIKERLVREATSAVGMVEASLEALWKLDRAAAKEIRKRDDGIDREEVEIEAACLRLLALQGPVAKDLRQMTFVLKVNADIERVADHACAIAKVVRKLPEGATPRWPVALTELGQRVPMVCHGLLRTLRDEDVEAAKAIVIGDDVIDALHKRLFDETLEMMDGSPTNQAVGLLVYRVGRELERIADLMTNIAEDIVYLKTGQIIRHSKKLLRSEADAGGASPAR
jgi:phosphate transport system protein